MNIFSNRILFFGMTLLFSASAYAQDGRFESVLKAREQEESIKIEYRAREEARAVARKRALEHDDQMESRIKEFYREFAKARKKLTPKDGSDIYPPVVSVRHKTHSVEIDGEDCEQFSEISEKVGALILALSLRDREKTANYICDEWQQDTLGMTDPEMSTHLTNKLHQMKLNIREADKVTFVFVKNQEKKREEQLTSRVEIQFNQAGWVNVKSYIVVINNELDLDENLKRAFEALGEIPKKVKEIDTISAGNMAQ